MSISVVLWWSLDHHRSSSFWSDVPARIQKIMAYPFLSQSLPSVGRGAALDLTNEVDELLDDDELANQEVRCGAGLWAHLID
jgi:hypothetical protein